jgi:SulP family sulfate permease
LTKRGCRKTLTKLVLPKDNVPITIGKQIQNGLTTTEDTKLRLPILQGVLPIKAEQIPAEVISGVTLAALAIPEVMGYTKISGTPVITGLYTLLIPAALFALFGSSRHLVVGADSATAAILAAGLVGLGATGSDEYVALAGILAFMAAGFLLVARLLRLGFMADFLSRTVLIGFLTGVGIQVSLGEVAGMLGLKDGGHGTLQKLWNTMQQIEDLNFYTLATTLSVLGVIVGSKRVSKKIPGALIAVVGAIIVSWAFGLKTHMQILGTVPKGLPHIALPDVQWSWDSLEKLVPLGICYVRRYPRTKRSNIARLRGALHRTVQRK